MRRAAINLSACLFAFVLVAPAIGAVSKPVPRLGAVRSVAAVPGDHSVQLTWKAPRNAAAGKLKGYRVSSAAGGAKTTGTRLMR